MTHSFSNRQKERQQEAEDRQLKHTHIVTQSRGSTQASALLLGEKQHGGLWSGLCEMWKAFGNFAVLELKKDKNTEF